MKKIIFFITIFFLCNKISYTQPGTLDPSFGANGIVKADLGARYQYSYTFR